MQIQPRLFRSPDHVTARPASHRRKLSPSLLSTPRARPAYPLQRTLGMYQAAACEGVEPEPMWWASGALAYIAASQVSTLRTQKWVSPRALQHTNPVQFSVVSLHIVFPWWCMLSHKTCVCAQRMSTHNHAQVDLCVDHTILGVYTKAQTRASATKLAMHNSITQDVVTYWLSRTTRRMSPHNAGH
jgi:hypothetical protein